MPQAASTSTFDLAAASETMMLVATLAIAGTGAVAGSLPRVVMPAAGPSGTWPLFLCMTAVIAAATALILPARAAPLAIVVIGWAAVAGAALGDAAWWDGTSLVAPAQSVMIALSLLALSRRRTGFRVVPVAVASAAVGLLLFGTVHLCHAEDVASLLPTGAPLRTTLPLLSGGLLIACSMGIAWHGTRYAAAVLAATIFLAWLPLVHAPRIVAHPGSMFEWQFASLALALSGALLAVAATTRSHAAGTCTSRRIVQPMSTEDQRT